MHIPKSILFKVFTLLLGIGAGLLLAECGIRWYWYGANGFSYTQLNSFKTLGFSGLLQRAENDTVLWELQPNLDTVFKFAPFSTNSLGMRDGEYAIDKPANTVRIAVIGDSFAMGSGVNDEENYPAVLEKLLNQAGNQQVEVLNFGVGGYNLFNYEAVLRHKALAFSPDIVVIGFCGGNDFIGPRNSHREGKLRLRPPLEQFWRSHLWKLYKQTRSPGKTRTKLPEISDRQRTYMNQQFAMLGATCAQHNIKPVLCYYSLVATEQDAAAIANIAKPHGFSFVNAGAGLLGTPISEMMVHKLDAHPNAATHREYATQLLKHLNEQQLLPH